MIPRLPPLRSIEAFVVVAETMSYSKAADALNITKSAVSRRIQSLEADLGVLLFKRSNKALTLTNDGDAYFQITGPAFGALRTAGQAILRPERQARLKVSVPESFASHWMMPRLPRFYRAHPEIELQLDSLGYFNSLDDDDIDVAIRVSREPFAGMHCEHLVDLVQFPVISPTLLRERALATPDDLAAHTLLHLKSMPTTWAVWLEAADRAELIAARSLHFDTMSLSLDAALNGLGVAMGVELLCKGDIDAGRLLAPLPVRLVGRVAIYFTCRKRDAAKPLIRKFKNWLVAEIQREGA